MANIITFTFKTEAPYTEDELDTLGEELTETVKRIDDDVNPNSFDTNLIDEDDVSDDSEKIRTEAIELIRNGTLSMKVVVTDDNDEMLFDTGDVPIAL